MEHPKSMSAKPSPRPDGTPCTSQSELTSYTIPVVVSGPSVDDVDDDVGVLDLEVLAALVQLAHVDLEGAGQPVVHRLHVEPELGHGRLREVVHALPRGLKKDIL